MGNFNLVIASGDGEGGGVETVITKGQGGVSTLGVPFAIKPSGCLPGPGQADQAFGTEGDGSHNGFLGEGVGFFAGLGTIEDEGEGIAPVPPGLTHSGDGGHGDG